MSKVDWDALAQGGSLRSVIDSADASGLKNALIDQIQWACIAPWTRRRRNVLDYGCGIGRFAARIERAGSRYCGVDTSAAMIESARRLALAGSAEFIHVEGLPLPFPDCHFDACLSVMVLQYLNAPGRDDLRPVLLELARVIAPGGEILIIEQASVSGRASGSVSASVNESRYADALAERFDVVDVRRIRCGRMSRLTSAYVRHGAWLPFRRQIVEALAAREIGMAGSATLGFLQGLDYYDVCIRAARRPKPDGSAAGSP